MVKWFQLISSPIVNQSVDGCEEDRDRQKQESIWRIWSTEILIDRQKENSLNRKRETLSHLIRMIPVILISNADSSEKGQTRARRKSDHKQMSECVFIIHSTIFQRCVVTSTQSTDTSDPPQVLQHGILKNPLKCRMAIDWIPFRVSLISLSFIDTLLWINLLSSMYCLPSINHPLLTNWILSKQSIKHDRIITRRHTGGNPWLGFVVSN